MNLRDACRPRANIFDRTRQDVALDLTDLIDGRIMPSAFFAENYVTEGMRRLLQTAFARFGGTGATGIIKLTQAMGGGKTHNMIAVGLLARHPELRKAVMGEAYYGNVGAVRVVAFTGRQSDAPFGIWGSIAEQLGKKELFKDYYSPLSAPGQTAWINLLKGDPTLILLDELSPYLEHARSKEIGNADLAVVTTTALSNLLVAVGKNELHNVCVVISDLKATYEGGTEQINRALINIENEIGRVALPLEPVALNTEEIYHILRTRLFSELPSEKEIREVAEAYGQALRDAKQMDMTNMSPEKLFQQIKESYPFHPSIRDLYARFRENPGFQQTRGLIRLMRVVVARMYAEGGAADRVQLIHPYDIDLNDRDTLVEITSINPTLDNAISHDIASGGTAVAEVLDGRNAGPDAQDVMKLLLVASLANVPNAVLGLTLPELLGCLAAPNRDLVKVKDVLGTLTATGAWYLHTSRDGRLFVKNVQNLVAKLRTTADAFLREHALKELRSVLARLFDPSQKDCYQEVQVLPALDELKVGHEKVVLIIFEPYSGGMHPELQRFFNDLDYKNRVLFLSGQRDTMNALLEAAKEHKAIGMILAEMDQEKVPNSDPQRQEATSLLDKTRLRLLSAARETFNSLIYPHGEQLLTADFYMVFTNNQYQGENQIREALLSKQKFTEDISSETFRRKCEQRLFTQKEMPWSEVKKRAAMNTLWQWHRPDALDHLKDNMVRKEQWRENGSYVEKGPFPPPQTDVLIQQIRRDEETGEVTLRLTPVHGDTVHYEIGAPATSASMVAEDPKSFKSKELRLSFVCTDAKGEYSQGGPRGWSNPITLKSRQFQSGLDKLVELRAAPPAPIRYTTDGSDPKESGGAYDGPFVVPRGTLVVLAVAERDGIISETHRLQINWAKTEDVRVDPSRPVTWRRHHVSKTTKESYELLNQLKKHKGSATGAHLTIVGSQWVELSVDPKVCLTAEQLEQSVEYLRGLLSDGQVSLDAESLSFPTGQDLLNWVADARTEIKAGEVQQ